MRKPARTILAVLSVAIAFLLFGLLQGSNTGFARVIEALFPAMGVARLPVSVALRTN